jgi:hypothetical protein
MTKELLNEIENDYWNEKADPIDMAEVFDLASKALEQQPCEDCISREVLLDKLEEPMNWTDSEAELQEQRDYEGFIELVKSMPSITPTRHKGKWIAQDIHNCHTDFKCSECSYIHNFTHPYGEPTAVYPYCPICGADMRGETE